MLLNTAKKAAAGLIDDVGMPTRLHERDASGFRSACSRSATTSRGLLHCASEISFRSGRKGMLRKFALAYRAIDG
jgi:hypothetical protein